MCIILTHCSENGRFGASPKPAIATNRRFTRLLRNLKVYSFGTVFCLFTFLRHRRHRKRVLLGISLKNSRFRKLQNLLPQKLEGFADLAELLVSTISAMFVCCVISSTEIHNLPFYTSFQKSAVFRICILMDSRF